MTLFWKHAFSTATISYLVLFTFTSIPSCRGFGSPNHDPSRRIRSLNVRKDSSDGYGYDAPLERRESIRRIASTTAIIASFINSKPSFATDATTPPPAPTPTKTDPKEPIRYQSKRNKISIALPPTFKLITQKLDSDLPSGQLFSAIDLNSGAVITVHRENACPTERYVAQPKLCDLVLSDVAGVGGVATMLSPETMEKDATKMMIRHDDRDNAALGGTSNLVSVEQQQAGGIFMVTNTVLPTGGTIKNEIGRTVEATLIRQVKTRVVLQTSESTSSGVKTSSLLGVWVSAPLDEWQKLVMGTKLIQIVNSIQLEGGQL